MDDSTTTLANSKINVRSIRHQMILYLFSLKVYFSNSEKIDKSISLLRNVIEFGKFEFGKPLNNILEDIFCRNIEKKVNDDQGNESEGDKGSKDGNNKDYKSEEGKDTCYLTD